MGIKASILSNREIEFNCFRELLSRRLGRAALARALSIVQSSLKELGGGANRVEQRLRITLRWCRNNTDPGLKLESRPDQIAKAYRQSQHNSKHSNAHSHHLDHARAVAAVCNELGLRPDHRNSIVGQALRLSLRARNFEDNNISAKLNRRQEPGHQKYNISKSNKINSIRRHVDLCAQVKGLDSLRDEGWTIRVYTLVLPSGYHSMARHEFGLAGAPDAKVSKKVLLKIINSALPSRNIKKIIAGVWRVEQHKDGTLHLNLVIAFENQTHINKFENKLKKAYLSETYSGWNFKVIAGFSFSQRPVFPSNGFPLPPRGSNHKPIPIAADTITCTDHLARCVSYQLKGLGSTMPRLIEGRVYSKFGALHGIDNEDQTEPKLPESESELEKEEVSAENASAEFIRIKIYQGCLNKRCSLLVSLRRGVNRPRFANPLARGPPHLLSSFVASLLF